MRYWELPEAVGLIHWEISFSALSITWCIKNPNVNTATWGLQKNKNWWTTSLPWKWWSTLALR